MPPKSSTATLIVECRACEATVAAEVIASFEHFTDDMPERTSFLKCPSCGRPLLVSQDYIGEHNGRDVWDNCYRLFPAMDRQLSSRVPRPVRDAVAEGRRCIRAKAYTASAIVCRKAIEGICLDQGQNKGTLYDKLGRLRDAGTLDPRLFEWADALRVVGNDAAHDVHAAVSREDALDLLQLAEAIADYLYTFRARFEDFAERQADDKKAKAKKKTAK